MIRRDGQPQMPQPENAPGEASRLGDLIERFAELAEATTEDRARYLAELTEREPGLADALRRMLEAEASDGASALDGSPLDLAAALDGQPGTIAAMPSVLPAVGGRYEVRRPLGFGSHGDVYLARQHEPVERDVAIKVLRPSQVRSTTSERMVREAGMLATLNHPGIATVHEAGQTDDGRPYIVTEFVDGAPIDRWCEATDADARTRCMVVSRVCRAVEHMHQRGVIHRDLKPTNILVAGDASDPRPKLVDLGIARILRADGVEAPPTLTQEGALLGSVGYIAPEQFQGAPADTRSDIFALGRVLERLLKDLADPWASRHARDLAAVVRMATESEPARRYASAGAFADDLEALVAEQGVTARPPSRREAAWRLMRRHKITTALAVLTLASSTAAISTLSYSSQQLRVTNEAQKALLKETMGGLTVVLNRYGGSSDQREALALQMEQQLGRLLAISAHDPELHVLRARLLTERARLHMAQLGIDQAEPLIEQAVAIMEAYVDEDRASEDDLAHKALAMIIRGDVLADLGHLSQTWDLYERVLELQQRALERFPSSRKLQHEIAWSHDRLTHPRWLEIDPGYKSQLMERVRQRLELSAALVAAEPDNELARYALATGYFRLAEALAADAPERVPPPEACKLLAKARDEMVPLVADDPQRTSFAIYLSVILTQMAACCEHSGDVSGSIALAEESYAVLERYIRGLTSRDERTMRITRQTARSVDGRYRAAGMDEESRALARRMESLEAYYAGL